tara:strand:+ start:263 stop:370 length:108 start_codon:yes stop_codon:yes gene_type:complete
MFYAYWNEFNEKSKYNCGKTQHTSNFEGFSFTWVK